MLGFVRYISFSKSWSFISLFFSNLALLVFHMISGWILGPMFIITSLKHHQRDPKKLFNL